MSRKSDKTKRVFMIGIGGISMSAIAMHLLSEGYFVSGSDERMCDETENLRRAGAEVFIGHAKEHVCGADLVIYNSAIKKDNPELLEAKKRGIETCSRIEMLDRISKGFELKIGVAGCHGKTTATAMLANILYKSEIGFLSHISPRI